MKPLAQIYTAGKGSQDLNSGISDPKPICNHYTMESCVLLFVLVP